MVDDGIKRTSFSWRDRTGLTWRFRQEEGFHMVSWYGLPEGYHYGCKAFVKTHEVDIDFSEPDGSKDTVHLLEIGRLIDVRVNSFMENRGVGSMLVKAAIEVSKRRGNLGLDGKISSVDRDHFDKLKHFYEKLGFDFELFDPEELDGRSNTVGRVFMRF